MLNFHQESSDPLQRMFNALEPGTYVQPHRHLNPDKRELFVVLRGSVAVLLFSDRGEVVRREVLCPGKNPGIEIAPGEWHTLCALEPGTIVFEVKDGPYNPLTDKNFAPWAPNENHPDAPRVLQGWLFQ